MRGDVFWQFKAEAHQEGRPVDGMETQNVLANKVDTCRPEVHLGFICAIAKGGNVVHQGIEPHIHDMLGVVEFFGELHAPVETGTGNGEVFKSSFHKTDHFVSLASRQNTLGVCIVPLQQFVLIFGEFEEVALLFYNCSRLAAFGAELTVDELNFGEECLTGDTVVPFIDIFVDVTVVIHDFKGFLYPFHMVFIGRSDELVVADAEVVPEVFECCGDFIRILLRAFTACFGRFLDLLAVFVSTGQKECIQTAHAGVACQCIGNDRCIGMADVGDIVNIIDGGGDVGFVTR